MIHKLWFYCSGYTIPAASSQFLLTSNPSPLEGAELCQEDTVKLHCAVNSTASVIYWFLCENMCTMYARAVLIIGGNGSVTESTDSTIAGLEITIDPAVSTGGDNLLSVNSTMSLNLSIYSTEQVRTFRCGKSANPESNAITLNFTIISMY